MTEPIRTSIIELKDIAEEIETVVGEIEDANDDIKEAQSKIYANQVLVTDLTRKLHRLQFELVQAAGIVPRRSFKTAAAQRDGHEQLTQDELTAVDTKLADAAKAIENE